MSEPRPPPPPPITPKSASASTFGDGIQVPPKRGGIDPIYGTYLGGASLDDEYKQTIDNQMTYQFASQRRNVKTISSIEQQLMIARDSVTTLKFDGRLESTVGSSTEIGKERLLKILSRRVEEHGQETFYHVKNSTGTVLNVLEHAHNFTLDAIAKDYKERSNFNNLTFAAYDAYEIRDITLSRLVVESLLTSTLYDKILVRYGHRDDFKQLPGSGLLMMALEACNASVSHDIDGAMMLFTELTLDHYSGENIADFATEALRLVKIMQGGYALPVHIGSRLLQKICKTSCEEFNRKMFFLLDGVKNMEYKYKILDPKQLTHDPEYGVYGPIPLLAIIQQTYGRLISTNDWPALSTRLPESNIAFKRPTTFQKSNVTIRCFRCGENHHIRNCPLRGPDRPVNGINSNPTSVSKGLAPWKYIEPKDLMSTVTDQQGRIWKFCTKCTCRQTK